MARAMTRIAAWLSAREFGDGDGGALPPAGIRACGGGKETRLDLAIRAPYPGSRGVEGDEPVNHDGPAGHPLSSPAAGEVPTRPSPARAPQTPETATAPREAGPLDLGGGGRFLTRAG